MPALIALVSGWLGPNFAKFAAPLVYAVIALLLVLGIWGAFKLHDHKVIAIHDATQTAVTATADKKADDNAGDQRVTDALRQQSESTQTQEAINAAKRNGSDPRRAYYDCVLKQQSARRARQPSPSC